MPWVACSPPAATPRTAHTGGVDTWASFELAHRGGFAGKDALGAARRGHWHRGHVRGGQKNDTGEDLARTPRLPREPTAEAARPRSRPRRTWSAMAGTATTAGCGCG